MFKDGPRRKFIHMKIKCVFTIFTLQLNWLGVCICMYAMIAQHIQCWCLCSFVLGELIYSLWPLWIHTYAYVWTFASTEKHKLNHIKRKLNGFFFCWINVKHHELRFRLAHLFSNKKKKIVNVFFASLIYPTYSSEWKK